MDFPGSSRGGFRRSVLSSRVPTGPAFDAFDGVTDRNARDRIKRPPSPRSHAGTGSGASSLPASKAPPYPCRRTRPGKYPPALNNLSRSPRRRVRTKATVLTIATCRTRERRARSERFLQRFVTDRCHAQSQRMLPADRSRTHRNDRLPSLCVNGRTRSKGFRSPGH
jgi:hypothetical protein